MTVKEKLHILVERLDDDQAVEALRYLDRLSKAVENGEPPDLTEPGVPEAPVAMTGSTFLSWSLPDLDTLAAQQGVKPIENIDDLRADFWPEDESIDDFLAAVREWRREGGNA